MQRVGTGGDDQTETDAQSDAPSRPQIEATRDGAFKILSNPRRRYTIEYLVQSDEEVVRLRDVAEQIAAWENNVSTQEITYKQRKRVYTSLYQTHLPKMDRAGVIEYDQSAGVIRSTPTVADLATHLNSSTHARRWERIGLLTSFGSGIVALSLTVMTAGGTGSVGALVISVVFVLVSIAQYRSRRSI
ncbi:hypothetical protein G6M89_17310 [Natronolimnobius sp. AArcel1]|uniref:DUF7344 domain-containing protein n=1 Tax=Natronolimnobius sp. AArcel1 TaxID=1679093 RepID=UPI0013EDBF61|nr:hypothetical protein [Natronolimnobius sp. AArcel1]NGM70743.1 hypothetical protein [Natronolimnobius sp. AArcel1]